MELIIVISVFLVCPSVCLWAYYRNRDFKFYRIFYACYPLSFSSSDAINYVQHFRFRGWRYFPIIDQAKATQLQGIYCKWLTRGRSDLSQRCMVKLTHQGQASNRPRTKSDIYDCLDVVASQQYSGPLRGANFVIIPHFVRLLHTGTADLC